MKDKTLSSNYSFKGTIWLFMLVLSSFMYVANAQQRNVQGMVTDPNGEPIIGATVMVKGASNGGITDVDGVYSLMDVPGDAMISISYVGYKTVDIKVTDKSLARVILKEDTEMLDEVVVVGYGVQKKSDITGSVSSVKSEELLSAPNTSTAQALQGRVSGVVVQNTSGDPAGAGPDPGPPPRTTTGRHKRLAFRQLFFQFFGFVAGRLHRSLRHFHNFKEAQ